jgi:CDP-glycerol glycerophosphotransferase (TagB/SpsB family)
LFKECDPPFFKINHLDGKKVFLYAPTWRKYHIDLLGDYSFDFLAINTFLKDTNSVLLLKTHPGIKSFEIPEDCSNIIIYKEDSYEIMNKVDILLTDYSSIYFDFLLLNRPIIFTPFDLERYVDSTPLYYEYNEVTPGPKTKNWAEVISALEKIMGGDDAYADRRNITNLRFNKFRDGNSCQRIADFIKQKIYEH